MKNNFLILGFTIILFAGACNNSKKHSGDITSQNVTNAQEPEQQNKTVKILFGSCNKQGKKQALWDDLQNESGDMFLWLGDNIYGDSDDRKVMQRKYRQLNANPGYSQFKKSVPIINGTWDDHDYGVNDGGKEYPAKAMSQQLMLDFLEIPKEHPRRSREGVYDKISLNKKGVNIDIFILDTRYFRDPIVGIKGKFKGESTGTILGKEQWKWLDQELGKSTADIHIFLSSIQLIAEDHGFEKWGNFPAEKKKFLDLVASHNINYPIILSGDRHTAEISMQKYKGYMFYDITSSSLNSGTKKRAEENRYRVPGSDLIFVPNYGILEISKTDKLGIKATIKTEFNRPMVEEDLFVGMKR